MAIGVYSRAGFVQRRDLTLYATAPLWSDELISPPLRCECQAGVFGSHSEARSRASEHRRLPRTGRSLLCR